LTEPIDMPLKTLCAGFSKDEKAAIESEVRKVLTGRPKEELWTVSVVKTGSRLAVTVDGPDERMKSKNFACERLGLKGELVGLLARHGFGPPGAAPPAPSSSPSPRPAASAPAPPMRPSPAASYSRGPAPVEEEYDWEAPSAGGERRDTHRCPHCSGAFAVTYEQVANEPRQLVSVACPHCWKVDRVEVSESAALAREYKAHKLSAS
jgi:hypothetical protein